MRNVIIHDYYPDWRYEPTNDKEGSRPSDHFVVSIESISKSRICLWGGDEVELIYNDLS